MAREVFRNVKKLCTIE